MRQIIFYTVVGAILLNFAPPIQHTNAEIQVISQIKWGHLNPARGKASPKAGKLWGDRRSESASGFLVKFKQGFSSPPHIHNVTYRGVVIRGLVHNDDPIAEKMWLPPGSFWIQPAGEVHITAADAEENLAYIEIDSGPYLVQPSDQAFDSGERPVNIHRSNLVWLDSSDIEWIADGVKAKRSFLWGGTKSGELNGSLILLPAGFDGTINNRGSIFHAVVIEGQPQYSNEQDSVTLEPGNYFGASDTETHRIMTSDKVIIYVRTNDKILISDNE